MHIGLRTILATAATSLALAPTAFADTGTETLVLARDACGGSAAPNLRLDWNVGASTPGCGNLAAGLAPVIGSSPDSYPSAADVDPFAIDQARSVVIDVSTGSFSGPPLGGIGDETISFDLSAKTTASNKLVEIGSGSYTTAAADQLRNGGYVHEFTVPIPASLAGATLKSANLDLSVDGSELSGYVNHDGSSFVQFPIPGDVDATQPGA